MTVAEHCQTRYVRRRRAEALRRSHLIDTTGVADSRPARPRKMEGNETNTIQVVLNGEPKAVPEGLNVAGLLKYLAIDGARVAVELNRSIVRRQDWPATRILEGAQLEVVWFVGGGAG